MVAGVHSTGDVAAVTSGAAAPSTTVKVVVVTGVAMTAEGVDVVQTLAGSESTAVGQIEGRVQFVSAHAAAARVINPDLTSAGRDFVATESTVAIAIQTGVGAS